MAASLHCPLSPLSTGGLGEMEPHLLVSAWPKDISTNPSPRLVLQEWTCLGLNQSVLSVQSAWSPNSLLSGWWRTKFSEPCGVKRWDLELLQPFCNHEGTHLTIKPTFRRGHCQNNFRKIEFKTLMILYLKITIHLDFTFTGTNEFTSLKKKNISS